MLRAHRTFRLAQTLRTYATAAQPHALVLLEHKQGVLDASSLSALTAARALGGQVTGLVLGASEDVKGVLDEAKKYLTRGYRTRATDPPPGFPV
jgi:electron transfer flavoprotein alpha subunit